MTQARHSNPHLPVAPVRRLVRPLVRFLQIESASGFVLLACTVAALVLANSRAADGFHKLWHTPVRIEIGPWKIGGDLGHFVINDVLMTVFFFVVGLEIKRELVAGELREPRKAALPVIAALGGMIVPAAIYMALQAGQPGFRGWGIPMATDIAFVVGVDGAARQARTVRPQDPAPVARHRRRHRRDRCDRDVLLRELAILRALARRGRAVPVCDPQRDRRSIDTGLRDRGGWRVVRVRAIPAFTRRLPASLLGLLTPSREWVGREALRLSLTDLTARLEQDEGADPEELAVIAFAARESVSPLERIEGALHPWVGFVIMPLFALANAGVHIEAGELTQPVAVAVALGLFLGKPIGVVLFGYLAVRFGIAKLPHGVNWWVLLGGGFLAGIGFTMSLFVAGLALGNDAQLHDAGKIGTLTGSVLSAIAGTAVLLIALPKRAKEAEPA